MSSELNQLLKPLRDKIDALDHQILDLLNQRAKAAIEVGKVKHGFDAGDAVIKPEREAQVIRALQKDNLNGVFPNSSVQAVWTEIISACRGLERGLTIA
ncbi:MAG TPA: chorismate mutase, partial [Oligella sp.]|nr:chorismate mutase [Oligella sp.]